MTWLIYWPGRNGGFALDDFPNIVENDLLHVQSLAWYDWIAAVFSSYASILQRPLAMLTLAANHYFTGLDPMPMKLTNIAIHALNAMLVYGLARRLLMVRYAGGGRRVEWAARFVAATWAVHPLHLMAVLYVVQRMESLSHTFVFAGLLLYMVGRQRQLAGRPGFWLATLGVAGGTLLGLLSKESSLLLPLYAFLVEACVLRFERADGRDLRLIVFYAVVLFVPAVVGGLWLVRAVTADGALAIRDFTLGQRLLTEPRVVMDYLRWTVAPDLGQLSIYHDDYPISRSLFNPPVTALAMAMIGLLLGVAAWIRNRRPLVALGISWFFSAHLLTATIIPLELVFEHRNYFALLGVCIAAADLLLLAPAREGARRIAVLVSACVVAILAGMTSLRAHEWSDPYRFAASEAAKHPFSPRASYAYAQLLVISTGYDPRSPAVGPAHEALEHARAVPGSGILPHSALALLAANTGQPQDPDVWEDMRLRLATHPIGPQEVGAIAAMARCARTGKCHFDRSEMIGMFEQALARSRDPNLLTMYGDYMLNVGHAPDRALALFKEAAALSPGVAQYRINLAKLLIATGDADAARAQIAALRALGRVGQYESSARELEVRLPRPDGQPHPVVPPPPKGM